MSIRQVVVAAPDLRPDLFLLGIGEVEQRRHPTATSYPKKFSPQLKDEWAAMFDEGFRAALRSIHDPVDAWNLVITEFYARCHAARKEPHDSAPNTTINDSLVSLMLAHRMTLGRVIDRLGVINSFRLKNIERDVVRTNSGFRLHVKTDMIPRKREKYTDKAAMVSRLASATGLFSLRDRVYVRHVNAAVEVRFHLEVVPWQFEYVITSHAHPELPVKSKAVSRAQYERFVINSLWLPAVRRFQFRTNSQKYSLA